MMLDERLANDKTLGLWLSELMQSEVFKAQLELENRILASARNRLEHLSLNTDDLKSEYLSVRKTIDAIKSLQSERIRLIENRNNRNPA